MNIGARGYQKYSISAAAVDIDWVPGSSVVIETIQINISAADTSTDLITMDILDADGDVSYPFTDIDPTGATPAVEFQTIPTKDTAFIKLGGKLKIDWANGDGLDVVVIIWYRVIEA